MLPLLADPRPLVRSISCWTLGRYCKWLFPRDGQPPSATLQTLQAELLDGLLKRVMDRSKPVQAAACCALAALEEEAGDALVPKLQPILQHLTAALGSVRATAARRYSPHGANRTTARTVSPQKPEARLRRALHARIQRALRPRRAEHRAALGAAAAGQVAGAHHTLSACRACASSQPPPSLPRRRCRLATRSSCRCWRRSPPSSRASESAFSRMPRRCSSAAWRLRSSSCSTSRRAMRGPTTSPSLWCGDHAPSLPPTLAC